MDLEEPKGQQVKEVNSVLFPVLWATNTRGQRVDRCVMQQDGNLVLYVNNGQPVWSTNTGAYRDRFWYSKTMAIWRFINPSLSGLLTHNRGRGMNVVADGNSSLIGGKRGEITDIQGVPGSFHSLVL